MDLVTETEMITTIGQLEKNALTAEAEMIIMTDQLRKNVLIAEVNNALIDQCRYLYIYMNMRIN